MGASKLDCHGGKGNGDDDAPERRVLAAVMIRALTTRRLHVEESEPFS